jgi:hypothetical protein
MVYQSRDQIIVGVIFESKLILDIYEQFNCPTDGNEFDIFILEVTKLFVADRLKFHRMKDTLGFLMGNKGNKLPKQSSGSLYTALSDIENIISGVEGFIGEELDEFEDGFLNKVYFATFN